MVMKAITYSIRVLTWLIYLVIILSLLITAPMLLGWKPVVVLTGSMEPAYKVGGLIYYQKTAFENIEVGDAITFKAGNDSLVTHRVVETDNISQSFITKGDSNNTNDNNSVEYVEVAGKTSDVCIPYAGYFISVFKNLYAIVVMALILLADYLLGFARKKKNSE